ncbi:AraC family transcriptional regulator [Alteromonas sp. D210916BOD_24]|uniref:AraC family transcriptional regulator n=1 Tax=Alteromonas sp. D210916BOD_24 TaxID=3157618 RepID=UPI00399C81AE
MASVSTAYIQSVLSYINGLNIEEDQYLALMQILPASGDARVPMEAYIALLNTSATVTQQPLFGFELGKRIQPKDYGVLGYLVESCENLEQAINALIRFDGLVADIGITTLTRSEELTCLSWQPKSTDSKQMVLRNTTAWVATVNRILGENYKPSQVTFTFPLTPDELTQLTRWFTCEIVTKAPTNSIYFPNALLTIPFTSENHSVYKALTLVSENELSKPGSAVDIKNEVVVLLKAKSNLRDITQQRIAEALFISPRTLQRKLKQQGSSFHQLLDSERKSRLDRLLRQNTIADTAFELGFQEQSSFTHAFKKWFSTTPLKYQQQLKNNT